jgi:hypothetical protein
MNKRKVALAKHYIDNLPVLQRILVKNKFNEVNEQLQKSGAEEPYESLLHFVVDNMVWAYSSPKQMFVTHKHMYMRFGFFQENKVLLDNGKVLMYSECSHEGEVLRRSIDQEFLGVGIIIDYKKIYGKEPMVQDYIKEDLD